MDPSRSWDESREIVLYRINIVEGAAKEAHTRIDELEAALSKGVRWAGFWGAFAGILVVLIPLFGLWVAFAGSIMPHPSTSGSQPTIRMP